VRSEGLIELSFVRWLRLWHGHRWDEKQNQQQFIMIITILSLFRTIYPLGIVQRNAKRHSKCEAYYCHKVFQTSNIESEIKSHYKISQFYRRKYSISEWLEVRRWFIYRRLHRRIRSVGFPFVSDSLFYRYIGRKNKKTICRWFYRRNLCAKKKFPTWNILTDFYSVGDIVIYQRLCTVGKAVGDVWNTDRIYPSVSVAATIKCRRIKSVGKAVSECLKYQPKYPLVNATIRCRRIHSVDKTLGNSFF
jgi:hypothetical protein